MFMIDKNKIHSFIEELSSHPAHRQGRYQEFVHYAIPMLASFMNVERIGVWFFSSDQKTLESYYLFDKKNGRTMDKMNLLIESYPIYFESIREVRNLIVPDVYKDPRTVEFRETYFPQFGITSMLDTAIFNHGKMIGVICIENVGEPITWSDSVIYIAGIVADMISNSISIYEMNATQQELFLKSKLSTIGAYSAEILHEVANPIGMINASLYDLKFQMEDKKIDPSLIEQIDNVIQSSSRVIKTFSAMRSLMVSDRYVVDKSKFEKFKLVDIIDEIQSLIRAKLINAQIDFRFSSDAHNPDIYADKSLMGQVLLNLIKNSIEAISKLDERWVEIKANQENGHVFIFVTDSGKGISKHIIPKIFLPFYTTKKEEGGSGLGLDLCLKLIQMMDGDLSYNENSPRTQFIIKLPQS